MDLRWNIGPDFPVCCGLSAESNRLSVLCQAKIARTPFSINNRVELACESAAGELSLIKITVGSNDAARSMLGFNSETVAPSQSLALKLIHIICKQQRHLSSYNTLSIPLQIVLQLTAHKQVRLHLLWLEQVAQGLPPHRSTDLIVWEPTRVR